MTSKKAKITAGPVRPKTIGGCLSRSPAQIWGESLGILVLFLLVIFFLTTSWRKWPDSLIDFGNSLYTAWRLAGGAVLYRDVDVDYGPLSQYLDGALFYLFGAGLMVLVTANLTVFAAIASIIHLICRQAWGVLSAFASSAVFIVVFAFSQSVVFGNYNYATPHSQEATHGMLICLLLVVALLKWIQNASIGWSFCAGLLFGLTAVLKPEFMLAGAVVIVAAGLMRWRFVAPLDPANVVILAMAAVIPTLVFAAYFSMFMGWKLALVHACHAWSHAARLGNDRAQMQFLGLDSPWLHLAQHLLATLWALLCISLVALVSWLADRTKMRRELVFVLVACFVVGIGLASFFLITWREMGRCFLGLIALYIGICTVAIYRGQIGADGSAQRLRVLISVLAMVLLSRMVLNGRYYQYGYYQAALAGVVIIAALFRECPSWLGLRRTGRRVFIIGCAALTIPGLIQAVAQSQRLLVLKTYPVAQGQDQFFSYPPQIDAQAEVVDGIVRALASAPKVETLLVLPEGSMINYLARLPSPVAPLYFYAGITGGGEETKIVSQLQQHPPDCVAIVSRDLRDYGIKRYGEGRGTGQELLRWVQEKYQVVGRIGADPFPPDHRGAIVLKRKGGS